MQLGSNTNVRHRGVAFHVQTEDSGTGRPHVFTHLFHQGTILASEKVGYAEWLGAADLEARVRRLMEEQHQAMLRRLREGELDALIEARLPRLFAGAARAEAAAPGGSDTRPGAPTQPAPRSLRAGPPRPLGRPDPPTPPPVFEAEEGERPLDELILEYLIDNARRRRGRS
jgi:hypothetical protein